MRHLMMFAILVLLLVSVQFSKAQSVDEIIEKHIQALGGKEKLLTLTSVKMEGSMNYSGTDVSVTTTIKNNVGSRVDISVPGMGDGYQILNTTKGWNFMAFQGQTTPDEVPEEDVKKDQSKLDIQGVLVDYKQKGTTIELIGKEKVDGADAYKLKVTTKNGKITTLFIDASSYYRIKSISMVKTPEGEQESEIVYADFKKNADGFTFPYSQTSSRGTIIFSNIETNKTIDESIFVVK
jgi:outer membrane lipoprotein-sorting protein